MYLPLFALFVRRDSTDKRLHCFHKGLIKTCDEIVVAWLLVIFAEDIPGKFVNIPSVIEANIREHEADRAMRLREGGNVEVGSQ